MSEAADNNLPPADNNLAPADNNLPGKSLLNDPPAGEGQTIATADGEWLLTPDVKGSGDVPDWFKGDKYKSVQDQAEAYTALESRFGSFTGSPDEYTFNVPEGIEGEFDAKDPLLVAGMEFVKESNMSQEGFDKMVALWLNSTIEDPESAESARVAEVSEVLGENAQQRISQVSGALSNMLDAETFAEIKPMVNTPQAVRMLEAVILAAAPKVSPINGGTNPEGLTMAKWDEMRDVRIADGPNKGELKIHKDPEYYKTTMDYLQRLQGEG